MDGGAWWAAVHGVARVRHNWATSLSLSCSGEGNGNPLPCSCLENPRDRGAWWAAISGVAQSWAWLKWLSSSSRTLESSFTHWIPPLLLKKILKRMSQMKSYTVPEQRSLCPCGTWGMVRWHMEVFWLPDVKALKKESLKAILLGFCRGLFTLSWLNHWSVVVDWTPSLSPHHGR